MKIYFYINGAPVDTYRYTAPLSQEDEEAITKIKQDAYRNFGYPPIIVVEED